MVCASAKNDALVAKVNESYPGRASMAPSLDLLITLLHWGAAGWSKVLQEREELLPAMHTELGKFAQVRTFQPAGCQCCFITSAWPPAGLVLHFVRLHLHSQQMVTPRKASREEDGYWLTAQLLWIQHCCQHVHVLIPHNPWSRCRCISCGDLQNMLQLSSVVHLWKLRCFLTD